MNHFSDSLTLKLFKEILDHKQKSHRIKTPIRQGKTSRDKFSCSSRPNLYLNKKNKFGMMNHFTSKDMSILMLPNFINNYHPNIFIYKQTSKHSCM